MSTKSVVVIAVVLIGVSLLAGLLLWERLPEQMASHWDENDQVNGYVSKPWGVTLMPLVVTGMLILFLVVPSVDPLKANIAQFREAFNLLIVVIVLFMLYVHGLTLAWGLGYRFRMSSALLPFMGVLFISIGYLLRQAKRNFFVGIRTPWTLSSDTVWDKTHQLGSWLFIASGVLAIVGGFIGGAAAFWLVFAPLIGSTIFLTIYSYALYRNETGG